MRNRFDRKTIAILAAFFCAVICGTAVNFLAKRAALTEPPIALNGWRTLVAAAVLLLPMLAFRISMKQTAVEIRWYVVLAALTMAVPHALIFFGLRKLNVTETTVAFVEAAVLGVVVVYLMAWGKRIGIGAVACTVLTLVGLAVFLGIGPGSFGVPLGDACIIGAAVATGIGLIIADRVEPRAVDKSFHGKCKRSTKKTFFACLISGLGTLLAVAVYNVVNGQVTWVLPLPATDSWLWIAALAIVGSCMTWFSVFLLIEFGQIVLAAAVIAAVPVTTEMANYLWFTPGVNAVQQWLGGALVLVSVAVLILLQLAMPDPKQTPAAAHAAAP